ncbi:MAG: hypothetical protein ACKV2T_25380 [Kofleriaceae bacterium]
MKAKQWLVTALLAGGALVTTRGCIGGCLSGGGGAPDDKLASHFEDLCKIAKGGVKDPVKGVRKLGGYLVAHTGDMMKNLGDTFAVIESIKDDAAHDARARSARGTMIAPLAACHENWQKFGEAVEANPDAADMVNRAMERLERTMNIIFSGGPGLGRFTFKDLPLQLESALSTTIR